MAGRGQSGVRMWKKAAIVKPVDPSPDKHGVKQPAYLRSHSAAQTSKRLKTFQSAIRICVYNQVRKIKASGKAEGDIDPRTRERRLSRRQIQEIFAKCAKDSKQHLKRAEKEAMVSEAYRYAMGGEQDIANDDLFWE